ncbi:hypothetical protein PanWU01x14_221710 [Parasponia andersonii]|uniref:Uncharacterized protein n=1 Tax=Parasponia andersonii TaxID=3476 RepID=A0A2P5BPA3_PARAD|nr:hypothetical protein PanWU01x14_221710 [Parasponia andersonii]
MAVIDIWQMFGGRYSTKGSPSNLHKRAGSNYSKSRTSGMEFESDRRKHKKSLAFTAEVIRSATFFMPWSCRIPIGDGYHEFL